MLTRQGLLAGHLRRVYESQDGEPDVVRERIPRRHHAGQALWRFGKGEGKRPSRRLVTRYLESSYIRQAAGCKSARPGSNPGGASSMSPNAWG